MKLLTPLLLALLSSSALCAQSAGEGRLALMRVEFPSSAQPGQRIVGTLQVKVIEAGPKAMLRPAIVLSSKAQPPRRHEAEHRHFTPWDWPAERVAGSELSTTVTLDVPEDFPPGPAELLFSVTYQDESGAAKSIAIDDVAPIAVNIGARKSSSARSLEVPLLVSRIPAPKIDGKIEDDEWSAAAKIGAFVENTSGGAPDANTRARVGRDDRNLYVAFMCDEPLMSKAVREKKQPRDAEIWSNECVEVLLDTAGDRAGYVHFIVDILNQRYDALGTDAWGFNPPWESAVQVGDKEWSVEIAIPFAALGVEPPAPGQSWRANLCRERKAKEELSAWRAAGGSFASPGTFGGWVFDSLSAHLTALAADLTPPQIPWPDAIKDDARRWQDQLDAWRRQVSSSESIDRDRFIQLRAQLDGLRRQHTKLKLAAAKASGQRFVVTRAWPYEPFKAETSNDAEPAGPIELRLLRDEWKDLAFDISNLTDEPLVLRCTMHHGDDSDKLGYARLGVPGLETQWQQAVAVAAGDGQLVYDALAPTPAGLVHIAPGATAQVWLSIHLPRDASAGNISGRVEMKPIDMRGGEPVKLPLAVEVIPLTLTENPPIHCFTWNFAHIIEDQPQWWRAHLRDLVSHGVDVCMISSLNHLPRVRASADGTMPRELDFAKLDRLLDATSDLFRLYWINLDIFEKAKLREDLIGLPFGSAEYERAFKSWLRQVLAHLHSKGITSDRFLINPYDESVDERCRLLARWVKEVDRDVRIVIDSSTPDLEVAREMNALTDVWVPHFRQFFPQEMQPFHELITQGGKPRWAYFYSEGSADKAQHPSRHYLSKFWWAFANDVSGMGYWAQQYYGDPWHRVDWKDSYDTALWYPIEGGVAPSRRWQAWRQGWQDYLLLARARQALRVRNDSAGIDALMKQVNEVVSFPGDCARADEARNRAKEILAQGAK